MPIADTKKFQTIVNLLYRKVTKPISDADAVVSLLKQAIVDNNLTSHLSSGELAALQSLASNISQLAALPIIQAIADRYSASHKEQALTIPGVNG